ncbi:eCIS core domain-containing protein [Persephonella sp.]
MIQVHTRPKKRVNNRKPDFNKTKKNTEKKDLYEAYLQFRILTGGRRDRFEEEAETVSKKITSGNNEIPDITVKGRKETDFFSIKDRRISPYAERKIKSSLSSGKKLDRKLRIEFESKFGYDFSKVNIHTGRYADELNTEFGSEAFTYGWDIYFKSGRYNPYTSEGKRLLAHELTHVVQQTSGRTSRKVQGVWGWIKKAWEKVKDVGRKIYELASDVKDYIFKKIAQHASKIPGFHLISFILGKNPITGEPVERNITNLLLGVVSIIPGAGWLLEQVLQSGVVKEISKWVNLKIIELNLTWGYVKKVFSDAINSLSFGDIKDPVGAINRISKIVSPLINKIRKFASFLVDKIPEVIFKSILKMLKAPVDLIMLILKKGREAYRLILRNPVNFLKNLIKAVKRGFSNFYKNIFKHLKKGFLNWLFGQLRGMDIKMPKKFDLMGIIWVIMQVIGLTYSNIKQRLIKKIGAKKVERLEKGFEIVKNFATKGPKYLVEFLMVKFFSFVEEIRRIIFEKIRNYLIFQIIKLAVGKLATLWNPVGVIFEAVKVIYNVVRFLYDNMERFARIILSIFNSISEIAVGKVGKAAVYIENTLAKFIPLAIDFFARFLKLGGLPRRIRGIIKRVRKPVNKLIDKVINWIVDKGKRFLKTAVKKGKEKIRSVVEWWKRKFSLKLGKRRYKFYVQKKGRSFQLMVSSSPSKAFENFVRNIRNEFKLKEDDPVLVEIKRIGSQIEEVSNRKGLRDEDKSYKLTDLFNRLLGKLKDLQVKRSDGCPEPFVVYGPVNYLGGATSMHAVISKKKVGSKAKAKPKIWKSLKPIRNYPPKYERGHLLGRALGGHGRKENLTPITREANYNYHYLGVERHLHNLVKELGSKKRSFCALEYKIGVRYKVRKKRPIQEKLEKASKKIKSSDNIKDRLKELIEALDVERKLAEKFVIDAWKIKKDPKKNRTVKERVKGILQEVPNNVGGDDRELLQNLIKNPRYRGIKDLV